MVLFTKLSSLPDDLKAEVEDFIDYLKLKSEKKLKKSKPKFGSRKGMFVMKPDFHAPLEDFKDYM